MKFKLATAYIAAALVLPACDTVQPGDEVDDGEIEIVTAIIAQSLSDRNEGLMSDMYDLMAELRPDGMRYGMDIAASAVEANTPPPWRGGTHNFNATYDPATGTHTIEYERVMEQQNFRNAMQARLQYVYRDSDGRYLQFPRRQQDDIASIEFSGLRKGELYRRALMHAHSMETRFERTTTWYLDGLDERAATMRLDGEQHHAGLHRQTAESDREFVREFALSLRTVDVTIEKSLETTPSLENRVSGTMQYEINLRRVMDGDERVRSYAGTIELAGDGTALLAFSGLRRVFRIKLAEGAVQRTR